jgi:hypothetical protein
MNGAGLEALLPHAFNAILMVVIGFFLKHELNDIKSRIVRIEDTFFPRKQKED